MAGYVASARLQGGVPRFIGGGDVTGRVNMGRAAPDTRDEAPLTADHVELVGRPMDEALADWLASIGESWSQLTFFLFDPDSWR